MVAGAARSRSTGTTGRSTPRSGVVVNPISRRWHLKHWPSSPDGQIVVIGVTTNAAGSQGPSVLARLNADGSLDTGFGQGGFAYDGGTETPNALAYLPDGKILEGATTTDTKDGISGILFELDRYIAPTSVSTPTITWANPADIVYGTALGATQLDATASVQPGRSRTRPRPAPSLTPARIKCSRSPSRQPTRPITPPPPTQCRSTSTQATPRHLGQPADIIYGTALCVRPTRCDIVLDGGRSQRNCRGNFHLHTVRGHGPHGRQGPDSLGRLHAHRHDRLHRCNARPR